MGSGYLLDSNVIIGYLAGHIPASGMEALGAIVDQTSRISVISQIEVLRWNDSPENEQVLSDFITSSIIYPLSLDVVRSAIALEEKTTKNTKHTKKPQTEEI
ncbi:hypothetical protein FACS1894137_15080 [Spirochaetia bacterium]|nr:hypothetical protein FACS1894137_15080 [Spirochaetia bacterium]